MEVVVYFQLGPHEVDLWGMFFLNDLPPKSAFHEFLDEGAVVASSDPHFPLLVAFQFLLAVHFGVEAIAPLKFEQQLSIRENSGFVDWVGIFNVDGSYRATFFDTARTAALFFAGLNGMWSFAECASATVYNFAIDDMLVFGNVLAVVEVYGLGMLFGRFYAL
jgi:hypothetical protein